MKNTTNRLYVLITILAALWCAGILAAPLMRQSGHDHVTDMIYSFFSRICHQNDAHTFYIFGEKFGVCIRCSAIYFGFFAGLLFLPLTGVLKRARIPGKKILIATTLPMVVDVILNVSGLHISTIITRIITGALFGFVIPWFIVPLFIEACLQLIQRKNIHSSNSGVCTYVRETQ